MYQSVFSQISYLVAFNDNIFALFSRICPGIAYTRRIKFLGLGVPFAPMRFCFPNWERSDRVGRAAGQPLIYVLYLHHFFLNGFKTLVVDYLRCPVHFYPKMGSCKSSMLLPLIQVIWPCVNLFLSLPHMFDDHLYE